MQARQLSGCRFEKPGGWTMQMDDQATSTGTHLVLRKQESRGESAQQHLRCGSRWGGSRGTTGQEHWPAEKGHEAERLRRTQAPAAPLLLSTLLPLPPLSLRAGAAAAADCCHPCRPTPQSTNSPTAQALIWC